MLIGNNKLLWCNTIAPVLPFLRAIKLSDSQYTNINTCNQISKRTKKKKIEIYNANMEKIVTQ